MVNVIILMKNFNDQDLDLSIHSRETTPLIANVIIVMNESNVKVVEVLRLSCPFLTTGHRKSRLGSWTRNKCNLKIIKMNNGISTPYGYEELTLAHLRRREPQRGRSIDD